MRVMGLGRRGLVLGIGKVGFKGFERLLLLIGILVVWRMVWIVFGWLIEC